MRNIFANSVGDIARSKGRWGLAFVGILALFLVAVGAYLLTRAPQKKPPLVVVGSQTKTVTISVEGMSCAACAGSVKKALQSTPGVTHVEVNLARRNARVQYDAKQTDPASLAAAVNAAGFKAGSPLLGGTK